MVLQCHSGVDVVLRWIKMGLWHKKECPGYSLVMKEARCLRGSELLVSGDVPCHWEAGDLATLSG